MDFHDMARRMEHRMVVKRQSGPASGTSSTTTPAAGGGASTTTSASADSTRASLSTTTATTTTTSALVVTTTTTTPAQVETTTTTTPAVVTTTSTTPAVLTTTTTTTTDPTTTTRRTTSTSSSLATSSTTTSSSAIGTSTFTSLVTESTTSSGTTLSRPSNTSGSAKTSSGPTTGAVIGIVAGALVAVVVVSAIVGYLFRKKWRSDDPDDSPFDRDEFKRNSIMLDEDGNYSGHHSPQMSDSGYSLNAQGATGLARNNTVLPGLQRNGTFAAPRPPSSIVNHYAHQQMMPSYQPGQVVPNAQYAGPQAHFANGGANAPGMDLYGGYPVAPAQQDQLNRVLYGMPPQHQARYHEQSAHPYSQAALERNASVGSNYSQQDGHGPVSRSLTRAPSSGASRDDAERDRPLSLVREEDEGHYSSRSGTPINSNIQQSYFSHGHNESASSNRVANARAASRETNLPSYENEHYGIARSVEESYDEKDVRANRQLSVRNGGVEADMHRMSTDSDVYGGVF